MFYVYYYIIIFECNLVMTPVKTSCYILIIFIILYKAKLTFFRAIHTFCIIFIYNDIVIDKYKILSNDT